ncbi:UDP-N-acetylmuramate dehydrogenase [Ilumatobacter sp.]|uniref:UDP-N-acetylmuramate dehydrogenase n=1 Tax=Ilumatobacter sp. TaxID=1967498 RepID=UPI003C454AC5
MPVAPPDVIDRAVHELGDLARRDEPLAPLTTYKVGGAADIYVEITDPADLHRVAAARSASGLPVLVVGRGSNLLVADRGFGGIAVSLADVATEIEIDTERSIVRAGSAVALPVLARQVATAGLTGFEWAVGVPGSIGGAVRMNAGGHGSDIAESLIDVAAFDLTTSTDIVLSTDQLGLRFRGSGLPATTIVLSARLQLGPGSADAARRELSEIVAWRRANQPGGQNAGSVFVNPIPHVLSAGQLIDDLGLRGFRYGTASVSEKHANFIQADPNGSADDVHQLIQLVRERVSHATGHLLRSEIRLIGFDVGETE